MMKFSGISKLLLSVLGFYASNAWAAFDCTVNNISFSMASNVLTIPRGLAINSQIGNEIVTPPVDLYKCTGTAKKQYYGLSAKDLGLTKAGTSTEGRTIYKTTVNGIGFAVGMRPVNNSSICGTATKYVVDKPTVGEAVDGSAENMLFCGWDNGILTEQPIRAQYVVTFYKIGSGASTGTATGASFTAANGMLRNLSDAGVWSNWAARPTLVITNLTVRTLACSIKNNAIGVAMNSVNYSDFKGGVGATTGEKTFQISLTNCAQDAKVGVTIEASSAGSIDSIKGILKLNPTSTASGVGVQLLKDGVPISFGQKLDITQITSDTQSLDIPLSARYVQTDAARKSGKVEAGAVFTMNYE